ncbi:MAG: DMT family transporter [Bacteroidetes bacterium]|nr:DMT family transporter [Bacteroidota bacterium]
MDSHHNPLNWFIIFLLTIIWGSSYLLIKKGLVAFSPVELASLRISISFLVSLPFAIIALRKISREKYLSVLQIGFFGSGAPGFLFALSMTKSSSAVNGILNSLSPLWTLLIGYYLYKVQISSQKIVGVIIGFLGAVVLVFGKTGGDFQMEVLYTALPVAATFCYGLSTNITKQKLQNENSLYTTSLAMAFVGLPAFIILMFTDAPAKIYSGTIWLPFMYVMILSLFGTLIAWALYYKLIQRTDALFGASVTYLIPVVAVGWGLFDGEVLSMMQLAGMLLILGGVYFTTSPKAIGLSKSFK